MPNKIPATTLPALIRQTLISIRSSQVPVIGSARTWCMLLVVSSVMWASSADARKSRGCHGAIYAAPMEITYESGETRFGRGAHKSNILLYLNENEQMVLIDGTGYCRTGQENKKCRKVAADAALKCAREIWDKRWDKLIPSDKCGIDSNAKIRDWAPGQSPLTQGILYGDIKTTIEYQACCAQNLGAKRVSSVVGYVSDSSHDGLRWGLKGNRDARADAACSRREVFAENYSIDCDQVRASGVLQCPKQSLPDSKPPSEQQSGREEQRKARKTAKTSKNTSTASASHADIKQALDKKKQAQEKDRAPNPVRTNPTDPMIAVNEKLRYRALLGDGNTNQRISSPRVLADFLDYGAHLASDKQMRLVDFEIAMVNRRHYYVGLWEKGEGTSIFTKPLSVVEFNKLHRKNNKKGLRLADFELMRKRGETHVVSLWRPGSAQEQFSPSMSASAFKQRNATLKQENRYPVDVEVRLDGNEIRYAALWRQFEAGAAGQTSEEQTVSSLTAMQTEFMPAVSASEFRSYRDELEPRGKQAIDIEMIKKNGETYFTALWTDGSGSSAVSKSRGIEQFKDFIKSNEDLVVDDLEIHVKPGS